MVSNQRHISCSLIIDIAANQPSYVTITILRLSKLQMSLCLHCMQFSNYPNLWNKQSTQNRTRTPTIPKPALQPKQNVHLESQLRLHNQHPSPHSKNFVRGVANLIRLALVSWKKTTKKLEHTQNCLATQQIAHQVLHGDVLFVSEVTVLQTQPYNPTVISV